MEKWTPEQLNTQAKRVQSDAELIKDGAEYVQDKKVEDLRLKISDKQLNYAISDNEKRDNDMRLERGELVRFDEKKLFSDVYVMVEKMASSNELDSSTLKLPGISDLLRMNSEGEESVCFSKVLKKYFFVIQHFPGIKEAMMGEVKDMDLWKKGVGEKSFSLSSYDNIPDDIISAKAYKEIIKGAADVAIKNMLLTKLRMEKEEAHRKKELKERDEMKVKDEENRIEAEMAAKVKEFDPQI